MQKPTYKGEVMLLRWADSSTGGRTVTFTLEDTPDDPERHPFKGLPCGKDGQRFALVVVPIGEAEHPSFEQPTEQPKPERPRQPWSSMSRAQQAGVLCTDPQFQKWLGVDTETLAVGTVRSMCGVDSRSQLDTWENAGPRWDDIVGKYRIATGQQAEPR